MRRSARFWLLKNLTLGCPRICHEIKPDPHDSFRGSHRALQEPGGPSAYGPPLEVQLDHKANERIRLNCHSKDQRGAALSSWSPRPRQLFAEAGTTFTDCVLAERLARSHRMLVNPLYRNRGISAIAYDAGFGDVSYFNRTFRRRYGMTPSEVREAAQRPK
jgi:hypothetical protein